MYIVHHNPAILATRSINMYVYKSAKYRRTSIRTGGLKSWLVLDIWLVSVEIVSTYCIKFSAVYSCMTINALAWFGHRTYNLEVVSSTPGLVTIEWLVLLGCVTVCRQVSHLGI